MLKMIRTISVSLMVLAILLATSGPAGAQKNIFDKSLLGKPPGEAATKGKEIEYQARFVPAQAQPGDEVTLELTATLAEGWHTFSLTQKLFGGSPTRIEIEETSGLSPLSEGWQANRPPEIHKETIGKSTFVLEQYHDSVIFSRRFRVAPTPEAKSVSIAGKVDYQICKNLCIPGTWNFTAELTLVPRDGKITQTAQKPPENPPKLLSPAGFDEAASEMKIGAAVWKVSINPSQVKPGETAVLSVEVDLEKPWHLYGLEQSKLPDGSGPGTPTVIRIEDQGGLLLAGDSFLGPEPKVSEEKELFPGLEILTHEGVVRWTREIQVPADFTQGEVPIQGRVGYMICTESKCDQPTGFTFRGRLIVADHSNDESSPFSLAGPLSIGEAVALIEESLPPAAVEEPPEAATAPKKNRALVPFLLLAISAGFVSLLTPCVFPMIPITVSFFLKRAESEHHRPVSTALIYCLGIVGTFTILGLGMSALFGATELNKLMSNPWLNLAIAGILIFFGANLLGLFEIRVPSWLLMYSSRQEGRGGIAGVLFMALTFTLTSFTCTFAFVGGLLVEAMQGDFYWPVIGMMAFSAAFSLPFFFLALFPSLLKKMPKSGGWMNNVKVVMGFLEVGAAFKFLSVADISLFSTPWIFDYHLVMSAWMITSVVAGVYLLGLFQLPHDTPSDRISVIHLAVAMGFLGLGSYLAVGLFGHDEPEGAVWENIAAFAPPRFESEEQSVRPLLAEKGPGGPSLLHDGLRYALDFEEAVAFAKTENLPLFLDFTGINCINCRKMETTILVQPQIKEQLRGMVLVQLYTDVVPRVSEKETAERLLSSNRKLQEEWFGSVSLPAYAVVTPDRKLLSTTEGYQSIEEFEKFLALGLQKWKIAKQAHHTKKLAQRDKPVR